MGKPTHNFVVKMTAVFLLVFVVLGLIGGTIAIYFLIDYNLYEASSEKATEKAFRNITLAHANRVVYDYYPAYRNHSNALSTYVRDFSKENINFRFVLKDENGNILLTNYNHESYRFNYSFHYKNTLRYNENTIPAIEPPPAPAYMYEYHNYTVDCYVPKTFTTEDRYTTAEHWINSGYTYRYTVIIVTIILLIAAVVLLIFLLCSAGHRKGENKVVPNGVDKIPLDIFLILVFTIIGIAYTIIENSRFDTTVFLLLLVLFTISGVLLVLLSLMSFATRYKLGGWWKNTLIYFILHFFYNTARKLIRSIKYLLQHFSLLHKTILGIAALTTMEFFVLFLFYDEPAVLLILWLLERAILVPVILIIVINLRKLQTGGQKLAEGDLSFNVDTNRMFWDFKRHGENLNSIRSGMTKAVDERMKSERFKTELITNVSHDIKTPLTSIINYVDLIQMEKIDNETMKEYVSVLEHQSARLKKLIDDLVEASKASTGNISLNMIRTDVGLLLTQAIGEYEEKMERNGLELIVKKPDDELFLQVDGRRLWRVFDNLMNNICKYAQPSTRVYLNMEKTDRQALITFRNISRYALNVTGKELFERFVRGDSSRNTEGSGLGLSIAKSLVELQNGELDLNIDGDLFKVVLKFNLA